MKCLAAVLVVATASWALAEDFAGMRGANYVPWCFWELMIGRTQFTQGTTPYQGVIYPDGACFDAAEVMHIVYPGQTGLEPKQVAADVGLPQRPGPWSIDRAWAWYKATPGSSASTTIPATS